MSPQTTTVGVPAGFTTVTPYVAVVDVERLIEFGKEAFGAVEAYRTTGSAGGAFCIMRIGDSMLMFTGGPPVKDRPKLNALHMYVPDADAVYQRAIEAGGESIYPPTDRPYGDRETGVKTRPATYGISPPVRSGRSSEECGQSRRFCLRKMPSDCMSF